MISQVQVQSEDTASVISKAAALASLNIVLYFLSTYTVGPTESL